MGVFQNLTGWHAIIILVVVLLLFGATKLPVLAKSVGQSMKIFKGEMKDLNKMDATADVNASGETVEASAPEAQAEAAPTPAPTPTH